MLDWIQMQIVTLLIITTITILTTQAAIFRIISRVTACKITLLPVVLGRIFPLKERTRTLWNINRKLHRIPLVCESNYMINYSRLHSFNVKCQLYKWRPHMMSKRVWSTQGSKSVKIHLIFIEYCPLLTKHLKLNQHSNSKCSKVISAILKDKKMD